MSRLAYKSGSKVREKPFPKYPVVTKEMRDAVNAVLDRGEFSTFIADKGEAFLGGKEIRKFEEEFAAYHGVKFAVSFNSATSALHAAVVASGAGAGDEVITTPYTFTSSATSALMNNAVPVFADIDPRTFCITAKNIEKAITLKTKAIVAVHLFGQCADMDKILQIAIRQRRSKSLMVIEDVAQAPGARYKKRLAGTIGDCGIFSLQESKQIPAGEGGMLITNNENIARTARLVRNHGEVIGEGPRKYRAETLGYNYRMTEFEAALGRVGLKHLNKQIAERQKLAKYLSENLKNIPGITPPFVPKENSHVYYTYMILFSEKEFGVSRELFAEALRAEGIPAYPGYVKPLYASPLYQEQRHIAFRLHGGKLRYENGLCPVVEKVNEEIIGFEIARPPATIEDMGDAIKAIKKIYEHRKELLS